PDLVPSATPESCSPSATSLDGRGSASPENYDEMAWQLFYCFMKSHRLVRYRLGRGCPVSGGSITYFKSAKARAATSGLSRTAASNWISRHRWIPSFRVFSQPGSASIPNSWTTNQKDLFQTRSVTVATDRKSVV